MERSVAQTNIGFGEAQGAFYVLVMGLVLSAVFFLGERYLHFKSFQLTGSSSMRHQNSHAVESKAQEINGLSSYKPHCLDHTRDSVASDIQLCHTDTAVTTLDEVNTMPTRSEDNGTNDAFGLSSVYSKVFSVSNIDNMPSTSSVQVEDYHNENEE